MTFCQNSGARVRPCSPTLSMLVPSPSTMHPYWMTERMRGVGALANGYLQLRQWIRSRVHPTAFQPPPTWRGKLFLGHSMAPVSLHIYHTALGSCGSTLIRNARPNYIPVLRNSCLSTHAVFDRVRPAKIRSIDTEEVDHDSRSSLDNGEEGTNMCWWSTLSIAEKNAHLASSGLSSSKILTSRRSWLQRQISHLFCSNSYAPFTANIQKACPPFSDCRATVFCGLLSGLGIWCSDFLSRVSL